MRRRWLRMARYALPEWKGVSLSVFLTIAGVFLDVLKPWPVVLLVDNVLTGTPLPSLAAWLYALPGGGSANGLLAWLTAATIVLFAAAYAGELAQSYLQAGVGSRIVYNLGAELFQHLQRLSLRFHGRNPTGDLVTRVMGNTGCVRDILFGAFLPTFGALLSLAMMFSIMWRLNPTLSLLALIAAPLLGILVRLFNRPMENRMYGQMQSEGELTDLAEQTLTALPIVRAYGQEGLQDRRFSDLCRRTGKAYVRSILAQLQFKVGAGTVTATATAVVFAAGGAQVLAGSLTPGGLIVFLSYLASLYAPMETLAYLSTAVASSSAGARRVFETLDADDHVSEQPRARRLDTGSRRGVHVRLEDVTFGYEARRPTLLNVSLEARPGESVALVGPSGAGKTTLVSLLSRFYDPWEGRVVIEGIDVRNVQLASLREQISFVLQDPYLLPVSIAENIAYGRPGATRSEIVDAAVAANAGEFINALPEGFDTIIGEKGATLSAGQRQRLSIARALLKDSPLIILDEPTSALDARTESAVMEALERLIQGRTSFIIAHRLSTARRAHKIAVLDQGRIVESGSHQQLLNNGGLYAQFAGLQFGRAATLDEAEPQPASA